MPPELKLSSVYSTPIFTLKMLEPQLKRVFGAAYHGKTTSWWFPAFHPVAGSVLSDLKKIAPNVLYSPEVEQHLQQIAVPAALPQEFSYVTSPYQHQIDGLTHLYQNIRAGLFYSPGMGKCKITVDLQRLTGDKLLILCPRIMLTTWAEEFVKHGGITDTLVIDGSSKKAKLKRIAQAVSEGPTATIATYGMATLYHEELLKIPYNCIVADESHQMKSPFAKRTKASAALASRAYRRILLSGTPSLGSPFDLYGQLRFLGTYFCPEDWWTFRKIFGVFHPSEANEKVPKMVLGFKNLDQMNVRVNRVCLRKTKEECLDLPDQDILNSYFPLSHSQAKSYNSLIIERGDLAGQMVRQALVDGTLDHQSGTQLTPYVYTPEQVTLLGKLDQLASGFLYQTTKNPQLCSGCPYVNKCVAEEIKPYTTACSIVNREADPLVFDTKENARLEHCEELLLTLLEDASNKVIIWANYKAELDHLCFMLDKNQIGHVRVQGGMSTDALTKAMNTFNKDAACRVYVGQVSTGIGVTLNAANYTIYYNLPWSLEHYQQSMDRNYRIGQARKVTVYRLLGRHTLDESKAAALDQKMDFSVLVTSRTLCATCPDFAKRCARGGIQLFSDGCVLEKRRLKETASIRMIPT